MISCTPNDVSDTASGAVSEPEVSRSENIALGASYAYHHGIKITNDSTLTVLTDGKTDEYVTIKTSLKKSADKDYTVVGTTWYGDSVELNVPNDTAMFYIDFGFMSKIDSASLFFGEYADKGEIEVYSSTDGYNYTHFCGSSTDHTSDSWRISFENLYCKGLMFVVPLEYNSTLTLSEIVINGVKDAEKQLLSIGASYVWEGTGNKLYGENTELPGKLTDGIVFDGKNDSCLLGMSGTAEKDEVSGKSGSVITFDLKSVMNISELDFGVYMTPATTMPERIGVRYSTDGETWNDFGQSYLKTSDGKYKNTSYRYTVTRNHTVKARYVKLYLYINTMLILDEVNIYGNENEVAEPDYGFIDKINNLSNTNVAAYRPASLNGSSQVQLTDMDHIVAVNSLTGENEIELELSGKTGGVCCAMLYTSVAALKDIKLSVYADGAYSSPVTVSSTTSIAGSTIWYLFFDKTDAEKIKICFTSEKTVKLYEAAVYASQPQLPVVKGGFFQLSTSGGTGSDSTMN
ncbi:MAG TPA: discoidin domain-containing protein, partial [Bacillota bacterium]|nr:discoidin domain-containing protein [Bacillota bacterium]